MMAGLDRVCLEDLADYFEGLDDPRSAVNRRYQLVSVVVIALMAVLAGAGGPTAIAAWAREKEAFLIEVLTTTTT